MTTKRKSPSGNSNTTSNSNNNTGSRIVRFNVGGTRYDVSRSLLEQHPDTMLARMVSERWEPAETTTDKKQRLDDGDDDGDGDVGGTEEALFIERNGERFQYCLDYMRDGGSVELPATISRKGFLQDLTYYGFEDIDELKITAVGSIFKINAIQTQLHSIWCDYGEELSVLQKERDYIQIKSECVTMARFCLREYMEHKELKCILNPYEKSPFSTYDKNVRFLRNLASDPRYKQELDRALKKAGWKLNFVSNCSSSWNLDLENRTLWLDCLESTK